MIKIHSIWKVLLPYIPEMTHNAIVYCMRCAYVMRRRPLWQSSYLFLDFLNVCSPAFAVLVLPALGCRNVVRRRSLATRFSTISRTLNPRAATSFSQKPATAAPLASGSARCRPAPTSPRSNELRILDQTMAQK